MASPWRCNQTDNLDGTDWQKADFDDTAWPVGTPLFYVETNPSVSPRNTPLSWGRSTYYFRTELVLPVSPTNLNLLFTQRIDDGAVFYLNGVEAWRLRMPPKPTPIGYATSATASPSSGDAVFPETYTLGGAFLTNLVQGRNILAVELHPRNLTNDDDVVFGTSVLLRFANSQPVVLQQPTNLAILDGRSAQMVAVVDGDPAPAKQWYKDGRPIEGATASTLNLPTVDPKQSGNYWLVASNALGITTSSNAFLTVLEDSDAPIILSALALQDLTNITVTFSEPIRASSVTNLAQYEVTQTAAATHRLPVLSAVLGQETNLILTTTPRLPRQNYSLRVSGVCDRSTGSNSILAGSLAPLEYEVSLVNLHSASLWRYDQHGWPAPDGWTSPDYNDSGWLVGNPLFVGAQASASVAGAPRSVLATMDSSATNLILTHYFRTEFDLPGAVRTNSLRLRGIIDDAVVFYINGEEVLARRMPPERPIAYTNTASYPVSIATYEPALSQPGWPIESAALAPSQNILAAELHQATDNRGDAVFGASLEAVIKRFDPWLELRMPTDLTEGSGLHAGVAHLQLSEPRQEATTVRLVVSHPTLLTIPNQITIPALVTNVAFDVFVEDDTVCTGPRRMTVEAQSTDGLRSAAQLVILDNETGSIALVTPTAIQEGQALASAEVLLAQPLAQELVISMSSDLGSRLVVPSAVYLPAGATSAVFQLTAPNNTWVDGLQQAFVTASVQGWRTATSRIDVVDDEPRTLQLTLPNTAVEGSGTAAGQGSVALAGRAVSPITVVLSSGAPDRFMVPPSVVIPTGSTNVVFPLNAADNDQWGPPLGVVITAAADSFAGASGKVVVLEDDAHHFAFTPISSPQTTDTAFEVTVRAEDPDGGLVPQFTRAVSLKLQSADGELLVDPTRIGPFVGGSWTGMVRVTQAGRLARFSIPLVPGESSLFHVEAPRFRLLSQPTSDLLWHESSKTLFAIVPTGSSPYADQIVAIDPIAGVVTNAYPIGGDPSQIEISGDGRYAYVALSNRTVLRRFDLGTRAAGTPFSVGSNYQGALQVRDFAIIGSTTDSVAARLSDAGANDVGVWRFDRGVASDLTTFSSRSPYWIEAAPADQTLFGYQNNNDLPLMRGSAQRGASLLVRQGILSGSNFTYRDGVLYDNIGRAASASTLSLLGTYPNVQSHIADTGLVEVDPFRHRVLYLAGHFNYGAPFYKFKAYDRDSFTQVAETATPLMEGAPIRFLRWATNGLVFNTSGGQIWFVRSEALQPTQVPSDLGLAQSFSPSTPVTSSDTTLTLTLTNTGPGLGTLLRIVDTLPPGATPQAIRPRAGAARMQGDSLIWEVPSLESGAGTACEVILRFDEGGWATNTASVSAYEPDPRFDDNTSSRACYVQLPPNAEGAFQLRLAAEDLLYDPARDRLLVSVGAGVAGQQNGLANVNPHNGAVESFFPFSARPGRLAASLGGETIYVSFPDVGRVMCLDLPTLAVRREFELGGEFLNGTWYPYFAGDLAVLPGQPDSIAVWRVRRAGAEAGECGQGIAVFDKGTMRAAVTEIGGQWSLEFDTDRGDLFAYFAGSNPWGDSIRDLRRCALSTNGVSFAESYPSLDWTLGTEFSYANDRLFLSGAVALATQPFRATTLFEGSEGSTLVRPDPRTSRVFFLGGKDSLWQLRAHEMEHGILVGSLRISDLVGTPSALIRCGNNGLAFRTSGGQLWIVRAGFADPASGADLAVALEAPSEVVPPGTPATFRVVVTNRGPAEALGVVVTNAFSAMTSITGCTVDQGQWKTNEDGVVWNLPRVPVGGRYAMGVTTSPTAPGTLTTSAELTATTVDPRPDDNAARRFTLVGIPWQPDRALVLRLPAYDLAWSTRLGRLFLTGHTNAGPWEGGLISLDPFTLQTRAEMRLGEGAGRLAVSEDGSHLFAALSHSVARLQLAPVLTRHSDVLLDPLGALMRTGDLEALRGAPNSFIVCRRSHSAAEVCVFDSDMRRTNSAGPPSAEFVLESGPTASTLYAHDSRTGAFLRYALDPQGIVLAESVSGLLPSVPLDLAWGDDRLFSSLGQVIDPLLHTQLGTVEGITSPSAVCGDPSNGYVFYVSGQGSQALVRAVDSCTLMTAASFTVADVMGVPERLVRWGDDGLAFTTSAGELGLLRSRLVPSAPPADLGLSVVAPTGPAFVGSNTVYTLTVTNAGPNGAEEVRVLVRSSSNSGLVSANPSQGTCVVSKGLLFASLGSVPMGSTASIEMTARPVQPGSLDLDARVTSFAIDRALYNNTLRRSDPVLMALQPHSATIMNLGVGGLVYSPHNGTLYAGGPGAQICVIQPLLARIEKTWPLPARAGSLSLAREGTSLYALMDDSTRLARLNPITGQVDLEFSHGTGPIRTVRPIPGQPLSFLLAQDGDWGGTVAVYDDNVARPDVLNLNAPRDGFVFGETADEVFGTHPDMGSLGIFQIDSNGIHWIRWGTDNLGPLSGMKYTYPNLYSKTGKILDPESATAKGQFSGLGDVSTFDLDASNHMAFFLTRQPLGWQLRAYDTFTAGYLGEEPVSGIQGTPSDLVRWGQDGLAFWTTSNQVFLVRSRLLPNGTGANLQLSASIPPSMAGQESQILLRVTNAGPASVTNVVILDRLPEGPVVQAVTQTQGTSQLTNGLLNCALGRLDPGMSASVQITLRSDIAGQFMNHARVIGEHLEIALEDNLVATPLQVGWELAPDSTRSLAMNTAGLTYDPVSGLLYVTRGSDVVSINPTTATLGRPIPVGTSLSRIAVSGDGTRVFTAAATETELRSFRLDPLTLDTVVRTSVHDIAPVPGSSDSVVVASAWGGLTVYDGTNSRPASVPWFDELEFVDATHILGRWAGTVPSTACRLALTPAGLAQQSNFNNDLLDGEMQAEGGLVYTTGGTVVDPFSLSRVRSFGVAGLVAPDASANRVAFLTGVGTTRVLQILDLDGLAEWGTLTLTNVQGEVRDLVRCGGDRLAFRTTGGQIFVIRSSAFPTGPESDLSLDAMVEPQPPTVGEPFQLRLKVSNAGPNAAGEVTVVYGLPQGITPISSLPSQGITTSNTAEITWSLGALPRGGIASNLITMVATRSGWLGDGVGMLVSSAQDRRLQNNLTRHTWTPRLAPQESAIQVMSLPASDLAWDRVAGRIYATLPASVPSASNAVVAFDPVTAELSSPIPVGPDPGCVAVSDSSQYLYVGLNGAASVARLNLTTKALDQTFPLNTGYQAHEISVRPGHSDIIAVAREFFPRWGYTQPAGVALYHDGSELSPSTPTYSHPITSLAWGTDGDRLYGYNGATSEFGFRRLKADANGVVVQDVTQGLVSGFSVTLEAAGGLVYSSSGTVLNPETLAVVTNLTGIGPESRLKVDSEAEVVSYVTPAFGQWYLRQYDLKTYALRHQFRLPYLEGSPRRLLTWGKDKLALLTSSSQVLLLKPSLAYADLMVIAKAWPTQGIAGQTFSATFAVTNRGPYLALDTWITNAAPDNLIVVDSSVPPGSYSLVQGKLALSLGSLPPGCGTEVTLDLLPTNSVSAWLTNSFTAVSAFEDVSPQDAACSLRTWVRADNDRDGLPDDWELAHALSPSDPKDGLRDDDGDGANNLQEYQSETDPRDAGSAFRIVGCIPEANGLRVSFASVDGKAYLIEASSSVAPGKWNPVAPSLQGKGGGLDVLLTNLPLQNTVFIRVRLLP